MTPAERATALLVAAAVAVLTAAVAALFRGAVAALEYLDEHPVSAPRHVRRARSRPAELAACGVSAVVRWYRAEHTGLKLGVTGESVALAAAVVIGVAW